MDVGFGPVIGVEKSGRKVARREGSLIIAGKKRAEVFAFKVCTCGLIVRAETGLRAKQAISVGVNPEGNPPVFRRLKRGSHLIVKSETPITSVEVQPLHPLLSGDEYAALCR